jgi:hypothetical protein
MQREAMGSTKVTALAGERKCEEQEWTSIFLGESAMTRLEEQ